MKKRIAAFVFLLVLAGGKLYADCEATPSISVSPAPHPDGTVDLFVSYSFPDTVDSSQRSFDVLSIRSGQSSGHYWGGFHPAEASGTMQLRHELFCEPSGVYNYTATAIACGRNDRKGTGTASHNHQAEPTVGVSYEGPDAQGNGKVRVSYNFPNTGHYSQRNLDYVLSTGFGTSHRPDDRQGVWEFDLPLTCLPTGTYVHRTTAQRCSTGPYEASSTSAVDGKPTVSLSAQMNADRQVAIDVGYGFPNTSHWSHRTVTVYHRWATGQLAQVGELKPTDQNGTWSFTVAPPCEKTVTYVAKVVSCSGEQKETEQAVQLSGDPKVQVAPLKMGAQPSGVRPIEGVVNYDMGDGNQGWSIRIDAPKIKLANGLEASGGFIKEVFPTQRKGQVTFTYTPPHDAQQVQILATASSCIGKGTGVAWFPCDGCDAGSATNDPVHLTDGNVSLTDVDPLPPIGREQLVRTYNSDEQIAALFGRGWTTLLERRLMVVTLGDEQMVSIIDDGNRATTFLSTAGAPFRQVFPENVASLGTLTHDAASGTYTHRAGGAGEWAQFAADGRLLVLRDAASGRETRLTYDADGLPESVTDSWSGTSWLLTIDRAHRRVSSIAVSGRPDLVWSYEYDANGNLVTVRAPGNAVWRTYEYVANRMTASRDPLGNLIESHTYDSGGYGISSTGPSDEISSIQYNLPAPAPGDRLTRVTYKTGAMAEYTFRPAGGAYRAVRVTGGCGTCGAHDVTLVRDERGRVIREQDARGYISVSEYDPVTHKLMGHTTALQPSSCDPATDPARCRMTPEELAAADVVGTPAALTTQYEYGDANWPDRPTVSRISSLSAGEQRWRTDTTTYDAATGNVLTRTTGGWTTGQHETRTTTTALYDGSEGAAFDPGDVFQSGWGALAQPAGMSKSVDGPRTDAADVTSFVYYPLDASVPAALRGRLAAVRNAAGHVVRFDAYDAFGNLTRSRDANGVVTESTFDVLGRLRTTTIEGIAGCDTTADPLCGTDLTSTATYFGGVGPLQTETRADGGVTTYTYDARGRVESIARGPAVADLRERMEYSYDPLTGKKSVVRMLAHENGQWVEKHRQSFTYDAHGLLQRTTHADGTFVQYTYGAAHQVAAIRDENHAAANTLYAYDPAGRIERVTQTLDGGDVTTVYEYDRHGNLKSVTDPNGNVTRYTYDDFGQLVKQESPVTGVTAYTYDAAENLMTTTDSRGAVTTRTYDALGRAATSTSTLNGTTESQSWTYDAGAFGLGRLSTMSDPTGSTSYTWERRGLLQKEQKTVGGTTYTTGYGYDAAGNRSRITYPSGRVVAYSFDYAGRPVGATTGATTLVSAASYLPFGPMTELVLGNGTTRRMVYDARYRISTNTLLGPSGPIASYTYGHDPAGNVTRIDDTIASAYNREFQYDDLNRLTVANSGAALWGAGTYQYDAMGNLRASSLGAAAKTFTYLGTTPKLDTAVENGTPRAVTYDAAGNELLVGSDSFAYTPRNHLAAGESSTYAYDGRGVRTVAVHPPAIHTLTVTPGTLYTGQSGLGTVTLTLPAGAGGAVVTLTSSLSGVHVPASVTVPEAETQATFPVTLAPDAAGVVTIRASYGVVRTADVTVMAGPPLASVTLSPQSLTGGQSAIATIVLSAPAPAGGATVGLNSSSASASLPSSVTIAAGDSSATAAIGTSPVASATNVTLTATYGTSTASAVLDVQPPPLTALAVSPQSIMGGLPAEGTVTLGGAAPAGGVAVALSSSNASVAAVPASVTVPAGGSSAAFPIATTTQSASVTATITAALDGISREATLTVTQCVPQLAPPPAIPAGETIWVDDALPAGVTLSGTFAWDSSQKASGERSLGVLQPSIHQQAAIVANLAEKAEIGEKAVLYLRVNECAPPREVKIRWHGEGNGGNIYWGEPLMGGEMKYMGPVPTHGQWIRAEVPFSELRLELDKIIRIDIEHLGGQVWVDRIGKIGPACIAAQAPPPTIPDGETIWIDDALPAGATMSGTLGWNASQKASGDFAIAYPYAAAHQQGLIIGNLAEKVEIGEKAVLYLRVNECAPPREVKIRWHGEGNGGNIYWGEPLMGGEMKFMGPVPTHGQWLRVEVPFSELRLELDKIIRIDIEHRGGQVWVDRIGKSGPACIAAPAPPPTIPEGETIWIDDALPAGATMSGTLRWNSSQKASGDVAIVYPFAGPDQQGVSIGNMAETAGVGDKAVLYLRVNECAPPREVKIRWHGERNGGNIYWGEALMGGELKSMGAVPMHGQWVRAEVPFSELRLESDKIIRIDIEHRGGQVWFDRIGMVPALTSAILTGFTASHASPQPAGTTITWTATATGSVLPLEYQFERQDNGIWSVVQPYGTADSFTWTPAAADAGEHAVRVSVRNGGSTATFDDTETLPMTITETGAVLDDDPPPIAMSVTMDPVANTTLRESHYLYTPELNLMVEATAVGTERVIEAEYIWFAGQPLAQIEPATNTIHYYFNDHLGTPILTTDSTATIDWRVERDPYGQIHTTRAGAERHQPLGLPGQEETFGEVRYNVFRWYRAGWGRYTQVDPLGWDSPWSRIDRRASDGDLFEGAAIGSAYAYALGAPTRMIDPTGESAVGAALPLAGGCTVIDGPLPVGDAVALLILAGAAIYDLSKAKEVSCSSCEPKKKKRWTCKAQCNTEVFDPRPGVVYPPRLTGIGFGSSETEACTAAKASATGSAPPGSYGRHCKCTSCWKN